MTRAPVAQLDRAPDFESVGRRFESCRARHSARPLRAHGRGARSWRAHERGPCPELVEGPGAPAVAAVRVDLSPPAAMARLSSVDDAPVAQLDRASASGAEGHRFESCRAHQFNRPDPERAQRSCESKGRAHQTSQPSGPRSSSGCFVWASPVATLRPEVFLGLLRLGKRLSQPSGY